MQTITLQIVASGRKEACTRLWVHKMEVSVHRGRFPW